MLLVEEPEPVATDTGKQVEKTKNGTYFQQKNNIGGAQYQSRYAIA